MGTDTRDKSLLRIGRTYHDKSEESLIHMLVANQIFINGET